MSDSILKQLGTFIGSEIKGLEDSKVNVSLLGQANGVATLDANGLVPSTQLPSYVDDVVEVADLNTLQQSDGDLGKIYVTDSGDIYRWTGGQYIQIANDVSTADSAVKLATARTIAASGDATWSVSFDGTADVSSVLTLAASGVTAGTYTSVTVDAKGRVTAASNPTTVAGYGITDAYTKTEVDGIESGLQASIDSNASAITALGTAIGTYAEFTTAFAAATA